ncbi:PAP2 superfamily C-terminal-domain-containing protein, partial [Dimargaris cristalligena]
AIFIVCLLSCWGLTYYFMNVMANVASYRSSLIVNHEVLPDLGFEVIPPVDQLWLTDFFDALMFAPTAIMTALFNRRPNYILVKGIGSSLIVNIMRITTVAITSIPDPRIGCEFVTGDFWSTFRLHRCGDCMFSGHTTIFVLCTMVWISHAPRNMLGIVGTFIILAVCVAGSIVVIANRAHYTMDVLVAWYISIGTWFTVSHL